MVANLAASKLSAGQITVGSGGMEFTGAGGIVIGGGGNIFVTPPGTLNCATLIGGALNMYPVLKHADNTVVVDSSKNIFGAMINALSGFWAGGNQGVTGNFDLKRGDGTTITMSFTGGLLTGSW
jgi:hypothetical protein